MTLSFPLRTAVALLACALGPSVAYGAERPDSRGAEGFGAKVKGGAGGRAIWVTNLNSRGPGSLRAALDTQGPRMIRFKVAGTIELGRDAIRVGHAFAQKYHGLVKSGTRAEQIESPYSFVTVDGASAPPPGVTIHGMILLDRYGLKEVILRHLRIRDNGLMGRSASDCLTVMASRVLVDHCSFQWARDEVLDVTGPNARDVTIQWCIIGPGWGRHGYGYLGGGDRVSLHHCLFANNAQRNPSLHGHRPTDEARYAKPTHLMDIRNNVFYNWLGKGAGGVSDGVHMNFVNNQYLPGPTSSTRAPAIRVTSRHQKIPSVFYMRGNISPHRPRDGMDQWADVGRRAKVDGKWTYIYGPWTWFKKQDAPFPAEPVITHSVAEAKALILSQAGAWPRDSVDAGVVRTVLQKTGRGGWKSILPTDATNVRPSAKATAQQAGGPLRVRFQSEARDSDGKVVLATWDFGDGRRAVGPAVTHAYAEAGTYGATLHVVDDQGMSEIARLKVTVGKGALRVEAVASPKPVARAKSPDALVMTPPTVVLPPALAAAPTEEQWKKALRLEPFIDQRTWLKLSVFAGRLQQRYPPVYTDARVLHDRKHLYLRFKCKGVHAGHTIMKILVSPEHAKWPWYYFHVPPKGRYSSYRGEKPWRAAPALKVTQKPGKQELDLLVAIPFRTVGVTPAKGRAFGLKVLVWGHKNIIHIWPPVGAGGRNMHLNANQYCVPHSFDPEHYAKMQFP